MLLPLIIGVRQEERARKEREQREREECDRKTRKERMEDTNDTVSSEEKNVSSSPPSLPNIYINNLYTLLAAGT